MDSQNINQKTNKQTKPTRGGGQSMPPIYKVTEGERTNGAIRQPERKQLDGSSNSWCISNHSTCKWIEFTNQMEQSGWKSKKTKQNKKQDPTICCLFSSEDTHKLKVKECKKILHASGNQRKWSSQTSVRQNIFKAKNDNETKDILSQ